MATLRINTTLEISVPIGTKVIANGEWITLAKKSKGKIQIFTCLNTDLAYVDLNDDKEWLFLTTKELAEISKL